MKLNLRRSDERGHANRGWLDRWHTFSFGDYHDPQHMGFRSLRVINQDTIAPSSGFPTHPHRDMEIFSYVLDGELEHQDSMGNGRRLKPGEIQLMSAGSGVTHSEYNPSVDKEGHFLQIWIQPHAKGLEPSYTEWHPNTSDIAEGKVLLISPDGRDRSATIHQDAFIWRIELQKGESVQHDVANGRGVWLQVIRETLKIGELELSAGDALSTEDTGDFEIQATADAEALLFDLK